MLRLHRTRLERCLVLLPPRTVRQNKDFRSLNDTVSRNLLPNSASEKGRAPPAQWAQQLQQKREGSGVARTTHTSLLTESTNQCNAFNHRDYFPLLPGGEEISKGLF